MERDVWPNVDIEVCPKCGTVRSARCPACKSVGSRWEVAHLSAAITAPADELLSVSPPVICPTCDEVFVPRWLRRCAECGHDFGPGTDSPSGDGHDDASPTRREVSWAKILLFLIAAAAVFYTLYDWIIDNGGGNRLL